MKRKAVSGIMLTVLLISIVTLAFDIQPVRASGAIHIRADGSVSPPTAPISTVDNITYTLTDNIEAAGIARSNIIVDGAGYSVRSPDPYPGGWKTTGIRIQSSNVTIRNTNIEGFWWAIQFGGDFNSITENNITGNSDAINLNRSHNNTISGNIFSGNDYGVVLSVECSNNSIKGNTITNNGYGIYFHHLSYNNTIFENNITANIYDGIYLRNSYNNTIMENNIAYNGNGISFRENPPSNDIYHNNFINNTNQVSAVRYTNFWDDGYPSGGNYWSDYEKKYPDAEEIDDSGIWDTPYIIHENNQDNYPLMEPWTLTPPVVTATIDVDPDTLNLKSKGQWITAYIQLSEGYNPEDIDATTILLNETIPPVLDPKYDFVTISSECLVDHNEDGILERMVKFDRAEVKAIVNVGNVTLTIAGEVNGISFEGSDTIKVIGK